MGKVVMSQIPPTKSFLGSKFILEPISGEKMVSFFAKTQDGVRKNAKNF